MTLAPASDDVLGRLEELGLPVPRSERCWSADDAAVAAADLDGPLVLKAAGLLHKSDDGGVALGLREPDEVRAAAAAMLARVGERGLPFLVQEMADGVEVLVGARRDPELGVTVTVGLGGTETELHRDV